MGRLASYMAFPLGIFAQAGAGWAATLGYKVFGFIGILITVLAAWVAAQLLRQPRFWRTESPVPGEIISVWLILTLVVAGGLVGLGELLVQLWPQQPTWLGAR